MDQPLFRNKNIIIFDMEVTNFELDKNNIVQFAARKYVDNNMIEKLDILINNPKTALNEEFKKRTRLNKKIISQRGISLEDAIMKIGAFIDKHTLVTYKGNFFYLQMLWFLFDYQIKNPTIDVIDVAKDFQLIGDPDDVSLEDLSLSLNLDFPENKWHNASHDVAVIEKIWFKLKALLNKNNKQGEE